MNHLNLITRLKLGAIVCCSLLGAAAAQSEDLIENMIEEFGESEFIFQRSSSHVPFLPVAYVGASHYGKTKVSSSSRGTSIEYNLDTVSQAAGVPWLVTDRDMIVVGEYLSWSRFDLKNGPKDHFNVATIGLPVGWLRQVNPRWQAAAFVMPMGHKANLDGSNWSWQTMGGVFARYVQNDQLWWAFGLYADIAQGDNFYIPYLGASWTLDEHWTISAVMPWPGVLYAPNDDWLFRLGVSPSGASWSASPATSDDDVSMNLDAWDIGLTAERRVAKHFYVGLEAGFGGFRGFRMDDSGVEDIKFDAGSSPYIRLQFKLRPNVFAP